MAVGLQLPSALHNKSLPNEAACLSLPVCPCAALWAQLSSLPITHCFNTSPGFCLPCCLVSLIFYSDLTHLFSTDRLKLMVYGWERKINKYSISERNTPPLGLFLCLHSHVILFNLENIRRNILQSFFSVCVCSWMLGCVAVSAGKASALPSPACLCPRQLCLLKVRAQQWWKKSSQLTSVPMQNSFQHRLEQMVWLCAKDHHTTSSGQTTA